MTTSHTIEGKRFCITGKLELYDRSGAEAAIEAAGGLVAKSVGPSTDFLVVGARAGSKLKKAQKLGIPVIEEADLESFLGGQTVEVEDIVASGDQSMRDLVGEARSLLGGDLGSDTWTHLLEIVDACAPDQLQGLVDYLEPQLARWSVDPTMKWETTTKTYGAENSPRLWRYHTPRGELCVAPYHWLAEMISGHDVLKHRLVRSVHLHGMDLNARIAGEIVSREHLVNLRWLDLSDTALSSVFWRKLRAAPGAPSLERLRFTEPNDKSTRGMSGKHALTALRELIVELRASTTQASFHAIANAEFTKNIKHLRIEHSWTHRCLDTLDDAKHFPELERVDYAPYVYGQNDTSSVFDAPLIRRAGHFAIDIKLRTQWIDDAFHRWTADTEQGPALLDLSLLRLADETGNVPIVGDEATELLVGVAKTWRLPPATERVHLGGWSCDELDAAFRERGVDVV